MGTNGSKDKDSGKDSSKPQAAGAKSAALDAAPLPGWTGPAPANVKIALHDLMPELAPGAATGGAAPGAVGAGAAAGGGAAAAAPSASVGATSTANAPGVSAAEQKARATFCEQLRAHGYAVIALDEAVRNAMVAYRDSASEFLRGSYEHKMRWAPYQPDPLLRELGSVPNEGYVFTPKLNKEYLKLKAAMVTADAFPDATPEALLRAKFHALHAPLHAIARKCWLSVAKYQDKDMRAPYMSADVTEQAQAWADVRSSISVIRYWELQKRDSYMPTAQQLADVREWQAKRDGHTAPAPADSSLVPAAAAPAAAPAAGADAAAAPADAKSAPAAAAPAAAAGDAKSELPAAPKDKALDESLHVPCGIHTDTGMLTFIVCAPVAGLQIANRFADPNKLKALAAAEKEKQQKLQLQQQQAKAKAAGSGVAAGAGDGKEESAKKEKEKEKERDEYEEEKPEVYDWLDVEKSHAPGYDLFVVAGRKCSLFAADKAREKFFAPTIHRVLLPDSTERYSILYFMDCQK